MQISKTEKAISSSEHQSESSQTETKSETTGYSSNDSIEQVDQNSYSAIRNEIAGALGTDAMDPQVDFELTRLVADQREKMAEQNLADNQAVIDAARTFGRHVVERSVTTARGT